MREINFITTGDKNYFPLIHFSIKQIIKFYPSSTIYIYDWGFTASQKKKISTYPNTTLIDWTDKLDRERWYTPLRFTHDMKNRLRHLRKKLYFANQKPICILDCAKRIKENLIYFDGDAILINPIDEIFKDNYDIGLTVNVKFVVKHKNKSKDPFSWMSLRGANAGIIFFTLNSIPMQIFIQEWIKEIKVSKFIISDQFSLFKLISKGNREILYKEYNIGIINLANLEYRIKIFPTEIYNNKCVGCRYNDKKVKFLHLISMKHHYPKNLSKSNIIRYFIREIKIRYAFYQILKLVSPILSLKIKTNIREIFNHFLIFKLLVRPYSFNLIKWNLYSVILNIKKKMKKQIL